MGASVTALRFFSLHDGKATEAVVFQDVAKALHNTNDEAEVSIGKAKGASVGFIFMSKPEMAEIGSTVCFTEVSGYDSVADHQRWRDTSEYAELTMRMDSLSRPFGLKPVDVLGKRRSMDAGSGIVHIAFEKIG